MQQPVWFFICIRSSASTLIGCISFRLAYVLIMKNVLQRQNASFCYQTVSIRAYKTRKQKVMCLVPSKPSWKGSNNANAPCSITWPLMSNRTGNCYHNFLVYQQRRRMRENVLISVLGTNFFCRGWFLFVPVNVRTNERLLCFHDTNSAIILGFLYLW